MLSHHDKSIDIGEIPRESPNEVMVITEDWWAAWSFEE